MSLSAYVVACLLTPNSWPQLLVMLTDSQLPRIGSDPIQNTISNSCFIVAFAPIATEADCHMLFSGHCQTTDDFLWLHYSGSQVSYHSILGRNLLESVIEALEESLPVFSFFESGSVFQTITFSLENELNKMQRFITEETLDNIGSS
jgi:hypothetical protein